MQVSAAEQPSLLMLTDRPDRFLNVIRQRLPQQKVVVCEDYTALGAMLERERPAIVMAGKSPKQPFPRAALVTAPSVRWIYSMSTGIDHLVPWDETTVTITNSGGACDEAIAHYVTAMMLTERVRLRDLSAQQTRKEWSRAIWHLPQGQTMLVFGAGRIGSCIAAHAKHFGMKTIGVRTRQEPDPRFDRITTFETVGEVMGSADFIVNCLPKTVRTAGRIGLDLLSRVKPGAYLIDVGRGGVLDHEALLAVLQTGQLAGAALDVFPIEPLPGHSPFWTMPNVSVKPHTSAGLADYPERIANDFCDRLQAWLTDGTLDNIVSSDRGY